MSSNNGTSWYPVNVGLTNTIIRSLTSNNFGIYAGTLLGGVFISTNNGANWFVSGLSNVTVYAMITNGNYLFAGTYNYGVYVSTNNGANWYSSGLTNAGSIQSFSISNGSNLYAGTLGGVYRSTNNGGNWIAINNGLTNPNIQSLSSSNGNILFAGTPNGVFVSTNNGNNWILKNQGFNFTPNALSLIIVNNILFVGTDFQSVWKRNVSEITNIDYNSETFPSNYSLQQNFPNPFNPTTNIRYEISKFEFVKLNVFNILGRKIETLVNRTQSPGSYIVKWEASEYPSGIYFYQIETENFKETKFMLLIK